MIKKVICPFCNVGIDLLFWGVVAVCCFFCLWNANFVFGDDHALIRTICRGVMVPITPITNGRFQLLCNTDANYILLLPAFMRTNVPLILYSVNAVLFAISSFCVAKACVHASKDSAAGWMKATLPFSFFLLFVVSADVLFAFWHNPILESRIIFGMSLFTIGLIRALETNCWGWHFLFLFGALLPMGYKENAFLLGPVFAGFVLIFGWRHLTVRNRTFLALAALAGLSYFLSYLVFVYPHVDNSYSEGRTVPLAVSMRMITHNPLLLAAALLAPIRAVAVLFFKSRRHLIWDGALFAALLNATSYVALKYNCYYYMTPDYVLLAPVLCHWLCWLLERTRPVFIRFALFALLPVLAVQGAIRDYQGGDGYWSWKQVFLGRKADISTLVELGRGEPAVRRVVYYKATNSLFVDYAQTIFGWFLDYAAGEGKIEVAVTNDLPMRIAADEALVLPNDQQAVDAARELREVFGLHPSKTSYYEIFRGPIEEPLRKSSCRNWSGERFHDFDFKDRPYPVICKGGFHGQEDWGRWSSGTVSFSFELPDGDENGDYRFALKVWTCLGPKEADVFCDGVKVAHWRIDSSEHEERIFEVKGRRPGEFVSIRIEQSELVRPCDIYPSNPDQRLLGLGFVSMRQIR